MTRALRLLVRRLAAGVATAHAAGALLLLLAVLVESAATGSEGALAQLPSLWARAAGTLSLLGAALAVAGLRRDGTWLGLATLGVRARTVVVAAALVAVVPAGVAAFVPASPASARTAWVRGEGGWISREGAVVADVEGGEVVPPRPPGAVPERLPLGVAAGVAGCGVALVASAGPVLVVAGAWAVASTWVESGG